MSRYMSQRFSRLEAYTPGEQPTDQNYIKLNTNESPYPPSEGVLKAIDRQAVSCLNLYPDPTCGTLKRSLATLYGVEQENVFVSNGSDDILNFSFMAFCDGFDCPAVFPNISYGFYKVYAELHGVSYTEKTLDSEFKIRTEDYMKNNATVVIANPNAPTGLALSKQEVEQIVIANPDHVVLIDEAYVDFGGESCVDLIHKYDNLLVVGTYSKSRSMAGARLGFAFGSKELIADLETIKFSTNPYNINRLTLVAGIAAIEDQDYYTKNCQEVIRVRELTQHALKDRGFSMTDSKANFIFAKSDRIGGKELYLQLKKKGILVRHFDKPLITDYNRITVGTKQQMEALLDAIDEILKETEKS